MSDGNVCLEQGVDSNCPKDKTLVVEVKGKVAEKGTVVIENGKIVEKLSTDESKKTKFEINNQKVEMVNGKLKYSEEPTLASLCEYQNNEAAEKTVGAKYKCNFGDGERYFYILELGSNPVNNSTLKSDEVALILNENYDEETLPWCDQDGPYPFDSKCAADGLTSKLEEIREKWESKLSDNQIVLPTVEQIATADGKVYTDYPNLEKTWLYQWEGNDSFNNGDGPSYGYWTSTLGEAGWKNYALGVGHDSGIYIDIAIYDYDTFGVRPVVTLKK